MRLQYFYRLDRKELSLRVPNHKTSFISTCLWSFPLYEHLHYHILFVLPVLVVFAFPSAHMAKSV